MLFHRLKRSPLPELLSLYPPVIGGKKATSSLSFTESSKLAVSILIETFIEEQGISDNVGLRVGVLPGGCSGFQYGLNIEDAPEEDDEIFDLSGIKVFVDPFSVQYLMGVEIDYVTSMMGSGFTFRNPNASGGCGCGSSFTV